MADKKEIPFTIDKQKALKIAKKAATEKFAMVKDEGFVFKVGTPSVPPMIAVVEVTDGKIFISGKGFGATIAKTIFQYISDAIDDAQSQSEPSNAGATQTAPQGLSIDDQLKIVEALKGYKELLDAGIITQEEFDTKKEELLSKNMNTSNNKAVPKNDASGQVSKQELITPSSEVVVDEEFKEKAIESSSSNSEVTNAENDTSLEQFQKETVTGNKPDNNNYSIGSLLLFIFGTVFLFVSSFVSIFGFRISGEWPNFLSESGNGFFAGLCNALFMIVVIIYYALNRKISGNKIVKALLKAILFILSFGGLTFSIILNIVRFSIAISLVPIIFCGVGYLIIVVLYLAKKDS